MCRQVQLAASRVVLETTQLHDELASAFPSDEGSSGTESERGDPAQQVVRDWSQHRPGGVGVEVARETVLETGSFLEITDGVFYHGVTTVVDVEEESITLSIAHTAW